MKKILVLYANSDVVMRSYVKHFLYSFRTFLPNCEVYYHNAIFNQAPLLPIFRNVQYVIFHHSVTTAWNRKKYPGKIESWRNYNFFDAEKIALMQDEYKNIDLIRHFISSLSIDKIFSVAPEREWNKIYGRELAESGKIKQYFTGYITKQHKSSCKNVQREFHIGYRAIWRKRSVQFGRTGLLKRDIALKVKRIAEQKSLTTDIQIGTDSFIHGNDWNKFLRRCKYVLGAPSGSSVLDEVGDIESQLRTKLLNQPNIDEDKLFLDIVSKHEGTLSLEVLSPRHFEAMSNGCAQILFEAEYNGLLIPWTHYLPLKRDFSNLEDILEYSKDDSLRNKLINACQRDFINSKLFGYENFVHLVLPDEQISSKPNCAQSSIRTIFSSAIEVFRYPLRYPLLLVIKLLQRQRKSA